MNIHDIFTITKIRDKYTIPTWLPVWGFIICPLPFITSSSREESSVAPKELLFSHNDSPANRAGSVRERKFSSDITLTATLVDDLA